VRRKLNPLRDNVRQAPDRGGRLDRARDHHPAIVGMLRDAGAARSICASRRRPSAGLLLRHRHPNRDDLLAANLSLEAIAEFLDVDSIAYISLKNLKRPSTPWCRLLRRLPDRRLPGRRARRPAQPEAATVAPWRRLPTSTRRSASRPRCGV